MTTTTAGTVSRVANVIIPVRDQDRVIDFYTDTLGLEKRADIPFGDEVEGRWVEVAPSDGETAIALCPPGPKNEAGGKDTGITLQTDDIEGYRELLADRGADVDEEVSHMGEPVPPLFWLRDPEGNQLMVVEIN